MNPDGVFRGHYRTDARGQNLNRYYNTPDSALQPQCFAYKQLVWYFHRAYHTEPLSQGDYNCQTIPPVIESAEDVTEDFNSGIGFLTDLHAHAAKRGAFLYGNKVKSSQMQAELHLYARLCSANSSHMDFDACCFSQVKFLKRKNWRLSLGEVKFWFTDKYTKNVFSS